MDAAVAKAEAAFTDSDRKAAWAEVQRIFSRDLPLLPLYNYAEAYVTSKNLSGYRAGPVDLESNWADEWLLK